MGRGRIGVKGRCEMGRGGIGMRGGGGGVRWGGGEEG